MHAYLVLGITQENVGVAINELAKNLKVKTLEFPLAKIEDTRTLNSFLKLKVSAPTAIVINSIDKATDEAANAFLKNLEEPQEDIYYFLGAESIHRVLPTIVSRCQVVKADGGYKLEIKTDISEFLNLSVGKKLAFLEQIKGRDEAKLFTRDLINFFHLSIHRGDVDLTQTADNLELSEKTLSNLEANGNVALQLTNLAINLK